MLYSEIYGLEFRHGDWQSLGFSDLKINHDNFISRVLIQNSVIWRCIFLNLRLSRWWRCRRWIFCTVDEASLNKPGNKQLISTEASDEVVRRSANSRGDVRRPVERYPAGPRFGRPADRPTFLLYLPGISCIYYNVLHFVFLFVNMNACVCVCVCVSVCTKHMLEFFLASHWDDLM